MQCVITYSIATSYSTKVGYSLRHSLAGLYQFLDIIAIDVLIRSLARAVDLVRQSTPRPPRLVIDIVHVITTTSESRIKTLQSKQ